MKSISIYDVQKACIKDLYEEWEPKINDPDWLNNYHYQSYFVLNLCRILHTVIKGLASSKTTSASWVKKEYPEWVNLIQKAEDWGYEDKMNSEKESIAFLKFVIKKVEKIEI